MAEKAALEYRDTPFDICFCSPLRRAAETAEILLKGRNVPIEFDERLAEMSFGSYEGFENIFSKPDCPLYAFFKDPGHYTGTPGGAESLDSLFERTGAFLREKALPLHEQGKSVLIVGHGAMNSSIVCRLRGLEQKDFWSERIENCLLKRLL